MSRVENDEVRVFPGVSDPTRILEPANAGQRNGLKSFFTLIYVGYQPPWDIA